MSFLSRVLRRPAPLCDPSEGMPEVERALTFLWDGNWTAVGRLLDALSPDRRLTLLDLMRRVGLPDDLSWPEAESPGATIAAAWLVPTWPHSAAPDEIGPTGESWAWIRALRRKHQAVLTVEASRDDPLVQASLASLEQASGAPFAARHARLDRVAQADDPAFRCLVSCLLALRPGPCDPPDLTPMWTAAEAQVSAPRAAASYAFLAQAHLIDWDWHDEIQTDRAVRKASRADRRSGDVADGLRWADERFWIRMKAEGPRHADAHQLAHNAFAKAFYLLGQGGAAAPHVRAIDAHPMASIWTRSSVDAVKLREWNSVRRSAMLPPIRP